jgi:hypothetical protein
MKGPFRLLHGKSAPAGEIALIYGFAAGFAFLATVLDLQFFLNLGLVAQIVVTLVSLDVAGGMLALRTRSTTAFYAERPRLSWVFLVAHIAQPAILFLATGAWLSFLFFVWIYALVTAAVILLLRAKMKNPSLWALGASGLGIIVVTAGFYAPGYLMALGAAYVLKLVYSFASAAGSGAS